MNILDITNEDIARLQENKIVFGLMDRRDQNIFELVGQYNCCYYNLREFATCAYEKPFMFLHHRCYRINRSYTLPAPTEANIIAYLQASEVPPAQWHPVAQEWARRHDGELIFEAVYKDQTGATKIIACNKIIDCMSPCHVPHRLRADYGKAKEPIIAQPCYKPSDVSYGPFTLEPEVCVWGKHCNSKIYYTDPHGEHCFMHIKDINKGRFCPVCGKRIGIKGGA